MINFSPHQPWLVLYFSATLWAVTVGEVHSPTQPAKTSDEAADNCANRQREAVGLGRVSRFTTAPGGRVMTLILQGRTRTPRTVP